MSVCLFFVKQVDLYFRSERLNEWMDVQSFRLQHPGVFLVSRHVINGHAWLAIFVFLSGNLEWIAGRVM